MKRKLTGALRSKTIWFSAVLAALGAIQANSDALEKFLTPSQAGLAITLIGVIVAVLRVVTTRPLDEK